MFSQASLEHKIHTNCEKSINNAKNKRKNLYFTENKPVSNQLFFDDFMCKFLVFYC